LQEWGAKNLLLIHHSTTAVASGSRLVLHACTLDGHGTVNAVVAQTVSLEQHQEREPRPCLQSCPSFRRKVVPLPVLVEPNLWHIAVLFYAKGEAVVGESLRDVVFEEVAMVVILPVLADTVL
jgi:hypothetical protein